MKVFLFCGPHCPGCAKAKVNLKTLEVKYEEQDVSNGGGKLAEHYGIKGIPKIVAQKTGKDHEDEWIRVDASLSLPKLRLKLLEAGILKP